MKNNEQKPASLSFDGCGINGPDEYRTRIATFSGDKAAKEFGQLFAATPELLEALSALLDAAYDNGATSNDLVVRMGRAAIAKATGKA